MRISRTIYAVVFAVFLSTAIPALAQEKDLNIALQRGYRTGYSDGYMAGYRDSIDNREKSFTRHTEFQTAERAYSNDYGTIEDYRDGYQQGFEIGYTTGFEKISFEASLPSDLRKRGVMPADVDTATTVAVTETPQTTPEINTASIPTSNTTTDATKGTYRPTNDAIVVIPKETELMLELTEDLSTERNREGDKFVAKVVGPSEIAGAIVEGRVSKITKPGRIKRRSEMTLTFDRIVLTDQRWTNFAAMLTEVIPVKTDNIKRVDGEGTAVGKSSIKQDAIKVGGATGTGLVIGSIAGGPIGAGIGAGMGAAFGVGAVVIERGKHVNLNKNQQLRIKTNYESQIR